MRAVWASIAGCVLISGAVLQASSTDRELLSTISNTQTLSFDPRGVIQIEQSFGDVEIQGWDRPEVEITTIRSTSGFSNAAQRELEGIAITAVKRGEDHLKITTEFPSRGQHADMKYVIKAPSRAKLVVHHDIGQVNVVNFRSDIEVTNRIGQIGLRLVQPETYSVNASSRIGDVSSDVGNSVRRDVSGHQLLNDVGTCHRQLYLRIGIGDISIRKINW